MKDSIKILLVSIVILPLLSIIGLDGFSKLIAGVFAWWAILTFCKNSINNDFSNYKPYYKILIMLLLLLGVYQIVRCVPQGEFLTLFGNPAISLWLLLPIFGLCKKSELYLFYIRKSILIMYFFIPLFFFINRGVESLLSASILFAPFILFASFQKYEKILIVLSLIVAFVWSTSETGQRYVFAMLLQSILMILICIIFKEKKIIYTYCILCIILPIGTAVLGIFNNISVFQLLSDNVGGDNGADTRSFLYFEVISEMFSNNTLIFGRGSLGRYFSDYFLHSTSFDGDHYERIAVEVGCLMYILKGGVLLLFLYMFLVIRTIYYLLRYGKNKLCLIFAATLSSHLSMMFIYEVPNINLKYLIYYMIISMGNNKDFLNMLDKDLVLYYENSN